MACAGCMCCMGHSGATMTADGREADQVTAACNSDANTAAFIDFGLRSAKGTLFDDHVEIMPTKNFSVPMYNKDTHI